MDRGFFSREYHPGWSQETDKPLPPFGHGRGRGRPIELPQREPPTTELHASTKQAQAMFQGKGKTRPSKPNGYIEFLKHMKKIKGVDGTINELMSMFDGDWKALSEEQRKEWRDKAKAMDRPTPSASAGAAHHHHLSSEQLTVVTPVVLHHITLFHLNNTNAGSLHLIFSVSVPIYPRCNISGQQMN
ncbi:hypothetical protein Ocin01_07614 [Orchesella cincta]|uniref:Uncharacterized protein n=1 Tax=Orchesella cincta TaxID=48709 RepID=A0A1D2N1I6_ORCCI|nr:hypothetical protein Ocin01_07614 [Orchesella cincta]